MDAVKKITQARVAMLFDHPFYGYLAMGLHLIEDKGMPIKTMATDGRNLYFDPDFVANTPLPELMGVIAHELAHCFLMHIPRRQNRVPERFNTAADYAVNDLVLKEFPLPKGILHDPQWVNKHVEYIYNHLPADKNGGGNGHGATLDSHDVWGDWGKGDGKDDPNGNAPGIEQQWTEAVAQAANQARARGKLPTHIAELVTDILQPKLDWRSILMDTIISCAKNDFTIMPPNKRHLARGIYLPSVTGYEIKVAIGIDSSGSTMGERSLFLGTVIELCDQYDDYTLHILVGDAVLHQQIELHPFDKIPNIFQGGGGTDFRPIFEAADKLDGISALVFLTDLDGTFPKKAPLGYETIWLATTDLRVPFGRVIRYSRNEPHQRRRR